MSLIYDYTTAKVPPSYLFHIHKALVRFTDKPQTEWKKQWEVWACGPRSLCVFIFKAGPVYLMNPGFQWSWLWLSEALKLLCPVWIKHITDFQVLWGNDRILSLIGEKLRLWLCQTGSVAKKKHSFTKIISWCWTQKTGALIPFFYSVMIGWLFLFKKH